MASQKNDGAAFGTLVTLILLSIAIAVAHGVADGFIAVGLLFTAWGMWIEIIERGR